MRRVRVVITGRVQGVGYRAWLADYARDKGLAGWVRNRRDGAVEAVISGSGEAVTALLAACQQGPASAAVEKVTVSEFDGTQRLGSDIEILPTV